MHFTANLRKKKAAGMIPVIPDFKRISPKYGELFGSRDPVETALLFERLGAPALSVVTEENEFGGSLELLRSITAAVSLPVLRKDFIRCEEEICRTAAAGADAVLLICACLTERELADCYRAALRCGLEALVEAHTAAELERAERLGANLVGINNRDIRILEKDEGNVGTTRRLTAYAPKNALLVSESGIETPAQAREAIRAGADAVLVGTSLWTAADLADRYRSFCKGEGEKEKENPAYESKTSC